MGKPREPFTWDGEKLRQVRLSRSMEPKDLAAAAGIGYAFLLMLERNDRRPSMASARRLAAVLGVQAAAIGAGLPDEVKT